jgi:hypothetical protein
MEEFSDVQVTRPRVRFQGDRGNPAFFAVSFNLIVLTTRLVLDNYLFRFANFAVAAAGALVGWERR